MIQAIEAICINGAVKPLEPITFEEAEHLVILRLPKETFPLASQRVRGAMKGMLSSVDAFIAAKNVEITLENDTGESLDSGNGMALLHFLRENRLPPEARLSAAEIDAQIMAEREAWG